MIRKIISIDSINDDFIINFYICNYIIILYIYFALSKIDNRRHSGCRRNYHDQE